MTGFRQRAPPWYGYEHYALATQASRQGEIARMKATDRKYFRNKTTGQDQDADRHVACDSRSVVGPDSYRILS